MCAMDTFIVLLIGVVALIAVAMGLSDRYSPPCPKCGEGLKILGAGYLCISCDRVYSEDEIPD